MFEERKIPGTRIKMEESMSTLRLISAMMGGRTGTDGIYISCVIWESV